MRGLGISGALDIIALTIQQVEGYYPGSLAYDNNNPGNLVYTQYYAQNYGAIQGRGGYAKFPDYDTGYAALQHQIQVDAGRGLTISEMMYKWLGYGTGGDYQSYAATVAENLGVSPYTKVADVLSNSLPPLPVYDVYPTDLGINAYPASGNVNVGTIAGLSLVALLGILLLSR